MVNKVNEEFEIELEIVDFFRFPNIKTIADYIDKPTDAIEELEQEEQLLDIRHQTLNLINHQEDE